MRLAALALLAGLSTPAYALTGYETWYLLNKVDDVEDTLDDTEDDAEHYRTAQLRPFLISLISGIDADLNHVEWDVRRNAAHRQALEDEMNRIQDELERLQDLMDDADSVPLCMHLRGFIGNVTCTTSSGGSSSSGTGSSGGGGGTTNPNDPPIHLL